MLLKQLKFLDSELVYGCINPSINLIPVIIPGKGIIPFTGKPIEKYLSVNSIRSDEVDCKINGRVTKVTFDVNLENDAVYFFLNAFTTNRYFVSDHIDAAVDEFRVLMRDAVDKVSYYRLSDQMIKTFILTYCPLDVYCFRLNVKSEESDLNGVEMNYQDNVTYAFDEFMKNAERTPKKFRI